MTCLKGLDFNSVETKVEESAKLVLALFLYQRSFPQSGAFARPEGFRPEGGRLP